MSIEGVDTICLPCDVSAWSAGGNVSLCQNYVAACRFSQYQPRPDLATAQRLCVDCQADTYRPSANVASCKARETCGLDKGSQLVNGRRVCHDCPHGFFQDLVSHTAWRSGCAQTLCDIGYAFKARESCTLCLQGTHQPEPNSSQPCQLSSCAAGTTALDNSPFSAIITCVPCTNDTYAVDGFFGTVCAACAAQGVSCQPGQYQTECSGVSPGECFSCPSGTTQPTTNYRGRSCQACQFCQPGYGMVTACNATHPTTCGICSDGQYTSPFPHNQPCQKHRLCVGSEYQVGAPSNLTDRICRQCPLGKC